MCWSTMQAWARLLGVALSMVSQNGLVNTITAVHLMQGLAHTGLHWYYCVLFSNCICPAWQQQCESQVTLLSGRWLLH